MKKYLLFLAACTLLLAGCSNTNQYQPIEYAEDTTEEIIDQEPQVNDICVSVLGAVLEPGVYIMPGGSRVYEAINLAGGLSETADVNGINLAAILSDEMQIIVPSIEDNLEPVSNIDANGNSSDSGKVNINTASLSELMSLTGIGEVRAQAIISHREQNGKFKAIEDIMQVSGIKENSYEKIKDEICVK